MDKVQKYNSFKANASQYMTSHMKADVIYADYIVI
jgi:hypothetical protein